MLSFGAVEVPVGRNAYFPDDVGVVDLKDIYRERSFIEYNETVKTSTSIDKKRGTRVRREQK